VCQRQLIPEWQQCTWTVESRDEHQPEGLAFQKSISQASLSAISGVSSIFLLTTRICSLEAFSFID